MATLLRINDAKICAPVYLLRFISVKTGDLEVSGLPETIKYSIMVKKHLHVKQVAFLYNEGYDSH